MSRGTSLSAGNLLRILPPEAVKRILIITGWTLVLFIQFAWTSSCNLFKLKPVARYYKPSENSIELPELKMVTEVLSQEHFEQTKGRSFDSSGMYMTNSKYHPVNLFQ